MKLPRVLIVDDEPGIRFGMQSYLSRRGFDVAAADSVAAALEAAEAPFDAALLDYRLHDGDALDVLHHLLARHPTAPVIVLTGHGSIEVAVEAMKRGARDFLTKPVAMEELERVLRGHLRATGPTGPKEPEGDLDPFRGDSDAVRRLRDQAHKVTALERPLLLVGETGTGKGVLCRWLHERSPRKGRNLVEVNCAGLSRDLLASELFGHAKGAFTGAVDAKRGLLEVADGGTLFLDEIGDMEPDIQPKLLKVLEEQRFRPVGEVTDRHVDLRLIAATHRDLRAAVEDGTFRADLFFRLSTFTLRLPPLRERREDIPMWARWFADRVAASVGAEAITFDDDALDRLRRDPWPGNLRQLRNTVERAVLLSDDGRITPADLSFDDAPTRIDGTATVGDVGISINEMEKRHIEAVLRSVGHSVTRAAEVLEIPRSSLYQKIKKYDITRD